MPPPEDILLWNRGNKGQTVSFDNQNSALLSWICGLKPSSALWRFIMAILWYVSAKIKSYLLFLCLLFYLLSFLPEGQKQQSLNFSDWSWSSQSRRIFQSAMLGARLGAYPAVTAVKNVDQIFDGPVRASGGRSPWRGGPCRWPAVQASPQQIAQALIWLDQSGGALSLALQQLGGRGKGHSKAQAAQAGESLVLPWAKTGTQGEHHASYQAACQKGGFVWLIILRYFLQDNIHY